MKSASAVSTEVIGFGRVQPNSIEGHLMPVHVTVIVCLVIIAVAFWIRCLHLSRYCDRLRQKCELLIQEVKRRDKKYSKAAAELEQLKSDLLDILEAESRRSVLDID